MIGTQLGSYQIMEEIGKGGMATVYRAYQPSVERFVAIKVIQKSFVGDYIAMQRFQREARLVARLEHPHVLPVYDFDGGNSLPYIVMRYLDSGTLKDILKSRQLSLEEIGYLIRQIASALDYAHRQGIIHRDIKPTNIMLDRDNNTFVTDFGIARMINPEDDQSSGKTLTHDGAAVGTPDYMAPEQGLGRDDINHTIDIYALGVILFQMLTRRMPYTAETPMGVLIKHIHDPIPSVLDFNPDLSSEVDLVVQKALAKNPMERYQTAAEFAGAVLEAMGNVVYLNPTAKRATPTSTSATPPTTPSRSEAATLALVEPEITPTMAKHTPTEQNKIVTVLDVNAAEYAEVLEEQDSVEAANAEISLFWAAALQVIQEYGGTVFKKDDNEAVALWGAETTREDDPERAVLAALAVQQVLMTSYQAYQPDEALPLNIGIHTGSVLLTPSGNDFSASGTTLILAHRLAQNATGMVLITQDTYRHVRGIFDLDEDDSIRVRGQKEKMPVYHVTAVKPRVFNLIPHGVEGIETQMIGRDAELRHLRDAFYAAVEDNETQVVTIVGQAGLGKTRLMYEFTSWSDIQPERFRYFQGRATPEMVNGPYALLRDMFSHRFEIFDNDESALVYSKMERGISEMLGSPSHEMAHFIGQLFGFDFSNSPYIKGLLTDTQHLTNRARRMFIRLLTAVGKKESIVMELEDIHWADDASLDLLNELVNENPNLALAMICTARPRLDERRPTWGSGQAFHSRIELRPLSKRDSRNLVHEVLKKLNDVPKELRDLIVDRAEGNPYYIEELIKMLIEDHVIRKEEDRWSVEHSRLQNLRVPPTLFGLLQARLDSLLYPERLVLQRASVLGRIFWDTAVLGMNKADHIELDNIQSILEKLKEREYIYVRETSTFEGSTEYIFAHSMLRDAVYDNLIKRQQKAYHASTADWLIANSGSRAREYTALIAEHYELAGEQEKAADYLRRAGEQSLHISAYQEALTLLQRAIALLSQNDHPQRMSIEIKLGEVYWYLNDYTAAANHLEEALLLAEKLNNTSGQANTLFLMSQIAISQGNLDKAQSALAEAQPMARSGGDKQVMARVYYGLGDVAWRLHNFDEATAHLEESLAIALHVAREVGDQTQVLYALNRLGAVALFQQHFSKAQFYFEECRSLAIDVGNRERAAAAIGNLGEIARIQGDFETARAYNLDTLAIFRELGQMTHITVVLLNLGYIALTLKNNDEATTYFREAMQLAAETGSNANVLLAVIGFAGVQSQAGEYDSALQWMGMILNQSTANIKNIDLPALIEQIKADVLPVIFDAALERGQQLDLEGIVQGLLNNPRSALSLS